MPKNSRVEAVDGVEEAAAPRRRSCPARPDPDRRTRRRPSDRRGTSRDRVHAVAQQPPEGSGVSAPPGKRQPMPDHGDRLTRGRDRGRFGDLEAPTRLLQRDEGSLERRKRGRPVRPVAHARPSRARSTAAISSSDMDAIRLASITPASSVPGAEAGARSGAGAAPDCGRLNPLCPAGSVRWPRWSDGRK